jgi:hypothetical protein
MITTKNKYSISTVEDCGAQKEQYPVDESQDNSNAGDAIVYEFMGHKFEVITWNEQAIDHKEGEKEMNKL